MWDYGDSCLQCMDSQPLEGNMIEEPVYQMCDIALDTSISKCKIQDFSFQVAWGCFKSEISMVKIFWKMYLALEFAILKRCEHIYTSLDIIFQRRK